MTDVPIAGCALYADMVKRNELSFTAKNIAEDVSFYSSIGAAWSGMKGSV